MGGMKNHFQRPCQCPTADIGRVWGGGWSCSRCLRLVGPVRVSHGIAARASPKGFLRGGLHARPRGWSSQGHRETGGSRGSLGPGPLSEGIKVPVFPACSCQRPPRRPQTDPSVSRGLGRAAPPWSAALSRFDEPSGGEWEGWASSVGVAAGCPVVELAGRTPGLGHTQVPDEAQHGLWKTAWLRTVVQASPPWRPRGGPRRGQRKNSCI